MNSVAAVIITPPEASSFRDMPLRTLEGVAILEHLVTRIRVKGKWERIVLLAPPGSEESEWTALSGKLDIGCLQAEGTSLPKDLVRSAKAVGADHLVLLGGHHPFADIDYASTLVQEHIKTQADYTTTSEFVPPGTAPLVVRRNLLESDNLSQKILELTALTDFLNNNKEQWNTTPLPAPWYLRNINVRLVVETEKDFEVAALLYGKLYEPGRPIALDDVIYYLGKNPNIASFNLPS